MRSFLRMAQPMPPARRNKTLNFLVSVITLWISWGFFLDAWAHGHVPVETFFTPYHGMFYAGIFALIVVLAIFRKSIPSSYRSRSWAFRFLSPPASAT